MMSGACQSVNITIFKSSTDEFLRKRGICSASIKRWDRSIQDFDVGFASLPRIQLQAIALIEHYAHEALFRIQRTEDCECSSE
jgi:hypothetical protein